MAPGLRERKKLQSWRAIRNAAIGLFEAHGYESVSIDDIAREADVSRTTFFNYFASKEAVVFDPDPEDREALRVLMDSRPATEQLWSSLQAVLIANTSRYSDRLALQKTLKASSPKLAASSRDMTDDFARDLHEWSSARTQDGVEGVGALQVNVALAVMGTAYAKWDPTAPFSELLALATGLFEAAAAGFDRAEVHNDLCASPRRCDERKH